MNTHTRCVSVWAGTVSALVAGAVLLTAHVGNWPLPNPASPTSLTTTVDGKNYPLCLNEDGSDQTLTLSLPCVWDAQRAGNHEGQSVLITSDGVYKITK